MDLSMGLPQEEPRERKVSSDRLDAFSPSTPIFDACFLRLPVLTFTTSSALQRDRIMSIARKIGGRSNKEDESAVASDEEDEGSDHKLFGSRRLTSGAEENRTSTPSSRRGSTVGGNEGGGANLGRRGSIFSSLASLSISRKKSISSRRSSNAHSDANGQGSRPGSPFLGASDAGDDSFIPPLSSATTFNSMKPAPQFSNVLDPQFPKVKSSQAAYIRRILGSAPNPNVLSSLKLPPATEAAVGGWLGLPASSQNGLMDSLRQFTAVEVLEGENSFACKKCWRWENPRADG